METKQVTVEEGDGLIAEFMGAEWRKDDYDVYGYAFKEFPTKHSGKWWDAKALQYHSSWDWLMPVVEKIEEIEDEHHGHFGVYINSNGCSIQATNLRTDEPLADPPHYFDEVISVTKNQATWKAVINFILWYNSTSKQTT